VDREELEALVRRGERAKVDLKAEFRLDVGDDRYRERQRSDLAWDIAAMANTRGGLGYLIIGVDEKTGLPSKAGPMSIGADQIQQIVATRCDPPVEFDVEWLVWATGEPVLVIVVPPSDPQAARGCGPGHAHPPRRDHGPGRTQRPHRHGPRHRQRRLRPGGGAHSVAGSPRRGARRGVPRCAGPTS
jgi:hypothetical protein